MWLSKNVNKKVENAALANGAGSADKHPSGLTTNPNSSAKIIFPDTSRMLVYDPRQKPGPPAPGLPSISSAEPTLNVGLGSTGTPNVPNDISKATPPALAAFIANLPSIDGPPAPGLPSISSAGPTLNVGLGSTGTPNAPNDISKATPPALAAFIANLPSIDGPCPDVDFILSICLQSNLPNTHIGKLGTQSSQSQAGPASSMSDISGSNKSHLNPNVASFKPTRDRQTGKRKGQDRQDDDDTRTVQSQPLPRDVFKIRQMRKSRVPPGVQTGSASYGSVQTGSASYGSGFSGELSGSTG